MVAVNIITCITKLFTQLDSWKYLENQATCIIVENFLKLKKKKIYENFQLIGIIFQFFDLSAISLFYVMYQYTYMLFFFQSFVSVI